MNHLETIAQETASQKEARLRREKIQYENEQAEKRRLRTEAVRGIICIIASLTYVVLAMIAGIQIMNKLDMPANFYYILTCSLAAYYIREFTKEEKR